MPLPIWPISCRFLKEFNFKIVHRFLFLPNDVAIAFDSPPISKSPHIFVFLRMTGERGGTGRELSVTRRLTVSVVVVLLLLVMVLLLVVVLLLLMVMVVVMVWAGQLPAIVTRNDGALVGRRRPARPSTA